MAILLNGIAMRAPHSEALMINRASHLHRSRTFQTCVSFCYRAFIFMYLLRDHRPAPVAKSKLVACSAPPVVSSGGVLTLCGDDQAGTGIPTYDIADPRDFKNFLFFRAITRVPVKRELKMVTAAGDDNFLTAIAVIRFRSTCGFLPASPPPGSMLNSKYGGEHRRRKSCRRALHRHPSTQLSTGEKKENVDRQLA